MSPGRSQRVRLFEAYQVAAARTGDASARARLVEAWQPRFMAHAWRLVGDVDMAREAVQDSWVEILKGLGALRDEQAFPAWSFRIVTRRCRRLGGRRGRDRDRHAPLDEQMPEDTRAADVAPDVVARRHLQQAIDGLHPEQKATLALVYLHELSVAEAARALDIPEGTIKTRLMHARRKLRDHLISQGVTP